MAGEGLRQRAGKGAGAPGAAAGAGGAFRPVEGRGGRGRGGGGAPGPGRGVRAYAAAVCGVVPLAVALVARGFVGNYPAPLGAGAAPGLFSEGRAMEHVRALAAVGDADDPYRGVRYVGEGRGRMGAAEAYLRGQLEALGVAAEARGDLEWAVEEHNASGGFNQHFLMHDMSNSYTDVKNIALRVAPKGAHARGPAVLVNAHYDSTVGTPGASDCASCVGVGLEMVHAVVHNASLELAGPLILVLNGAEETFMQAAHGFLQHPWSSQVGAVINLESTGSGGPDLVFRMRGALPVRAYAESAPRPHATVAGQDLFATGLIPADTDFYVFAHPEYGNWPGIDVATILDGEAYHTNRDVPERIWPGSLQSLGENMLPTALRMAQLLQQERKGGEGGKGAPTGGGLSNTDQGTYFSVLSAFTVHYSHEVALLLHLLPCLLVLLVPLRLGIGPWQLAAGAAKQLAAALLAVACSAAVAVLAPAVVGRSMAWYGKYWLAGLIFIPSAAAGLLLPYSRSPAPSSKANASGLGVERLVADLCGSALMLAFFAAAGTATVAPNSGFVPASASAFCLATAGLLNSNGGSLSAGKGALVAVLALGPGLIFWDVSFTTWLLFLGRIALVGSAASPLAFLIPEVAMGAVTAVFTYLSFGWLSPVLQHALHLLEGPGGGGKGGSRWKVHKVLLGVSLNASIFGAIVFEAFSAHYPKRVLMLHAHTVERAGGGGDYRISRSQWILGGADFTKLGPVLEPIGPGVVGQPLGGAVEWQPANKDDLLGLYPVTDLLNDAVATVDGRSPSKEDVMGIPEFGVTVADRHCGGSPTEPHEKGVRCCHVQMTQASEARATALHGVRIRGPVSWWSFTRQHPDQRPKAMTDNVGPFYIARHAGSPRLSFEVEASGPEPLQLEVGALNLELSERVLQVLSALPGFTAPMPATSYNFRATC